MESRRDESGSFLGEQREKDAVFALRCHTRSPTRTPLEFPLHDPRQVTFGFARDISVGGIFVETEFPAPFASVVTIRMMLPGLADEMVAMGHVRWTRARGMGVEFVSVGADETRAIRHL